MRHTFATVLLAFVSGALPAMAEGVTGKWLTEGGKSHVEITPCEGSAALCGAIVWLREPLNDAGEEKRDINNPEPTMRDRPIVGLPLLTGFRRSAAEPDVWEGGEIYNPEDGELYSCTLTLLDEDTLRVRGYVGLPIFGKTQVWKRVE